jgi:ketosteroid isomerase-like protein
MSQENIEIVQQLYAETTAALEPPQELFHPEYELDARDVAPDFGVVTGFDASTAALREYWETFEAFHVHLEEVVHADGGCVVTAVRDGGQLKGSDAEVWNRFFHVWTLQEGTVVRLSIHTDKGRALEAAGLSE